jgi:hypothetical protein
MNLSHPTVQNRSSFAQPGIKNFDPNQHTFVKVNIQARHSLKQHKNSLHGTNIRPTLHSKQERIISKLKMRHHHRILITHTVPREQVLFYHSLYQNIQTIGCQKEEKRGQQVPLSKTPL